MFAKNAFNGEIVEMATENESDKFRQVEMQQRSIGEKELVEIDRALALRERNLPSVAASAI